MGLAGHNFSGDDELRVRTRPAGAVDPIRALKVTKDYTRAFFDQILQGKAHPLLAGISPDYPEVTLDIVRPPRQ